MRVKIQRLNLNLPLPQYSHPSDAGVDLYYAGEDIEIQPLSRQILPTGIKVAVPVGYELQIRPRSGLAFKEGLTVLNTPGTIDSGYRGEVKIIIFNSNPSTSIKIKKCQRIAQAVLKKVETIEWEEVVSLDNTSRNTGGFGSTGE